MRAGDAILKWLNKNHQALGPYRNQYIACTAQGIIANGCELQHVLDVAQHSGKAFAIYLVPRHTASIVLLPVRLRSVSRPCLAPNLYCAPQAWC